FYHKIEEKQKYEETIYLMHQQYPRYLIGRLQYAMHLLHHDQPQEAFDSIECAANIKDVFPERDTFHITEIAKFYEFLIIYYARTNRRNEAEHYYQALT